MLSNGQNHERAVITFAGYCVNKWIMDLELSKTIARIKERQLATVTPQEKVVRSLASDVSDYWESHKREEKSVTSYTDPKNLQSILIIQCIFRHWILLSKMRNERKYLGFDLKSKLGIAQSAIRRLFAVQEVRLAEATQALNAEMFTDFCTRMAAGVRIGMFSRRHGTLELRTLKFSDDFKLLTYQASRYTPRRTLTIKQIHKVSRDLSTNLYPKARPKHKAWCFHLHVLAGHDNGYFLDFEPLNHSDSKILFHGFSHLVKMASSQSPFYIDTLGIPSRAVGSIIRSSLRDDASNAHNHAEHRKYKGCRSEADFMRFRIAVRGLSQEYAAWDKLKMEEETAFRIHLRQLNASKGQGGTIEKSATDGQNPASAWSANETNADFSSSEDEFAINGKEESNEDSASEDFYQHEPPKNPASFQAVNDHSQPQISSKLASKWDIPTIGSTGPTADMDEYSISSSSEKSLGQERNVTSSTRIQTPAAVRFVDMANPQLEGTSGAFKETANDEQVEDDDDDSLGTSDLLRGEHISVSPIK